MRDFICNESREQQCKEAIRFSISSKLSLAKWNAVRQYRASSAIKFQSMDGPTLCHFVNGGLHCAPLSSLYCTITGQAVEWLKYSCLFVHLSMNWTRHFSHWHLYLFRFAIWAHIVRSHFDRVYIISFEMLILELWIFNRFIHFSFYSLQCNRSRNVTWASCKICFLSCNAYVHTRTTSFVSCNK